MTYKQSILNGYGPQNVCAYCWITNGFSIEYTFSIEQLPLDCNPVLVANAQAAIIYPYVEGGTGKALLLSEFFALTQIDGCTLTCNFGATCGQATDLTAHQTTVTPTAIFTDSTPATWDSASGTAHPFDGLSALDNVVEGHGPSTVCLQCISNNAVTNSPFEKSIVITQTKLDCSPLL
jgi:hypothetical protein